MGSVFGGGSIQFARVFGIRIGVDPSWFFVLFLIIWSLSGYYEDRFPGGSTAFVLAAVSALLFFLSVLLHELGHAFEARRSGIGITGIDLWMFGGVAKLERDSKNAGEEFRVAIAGPIVTLLIAVVCWVICAVALGMDAASSAMRLEVDAMPDEAALAVIAYLGFVNVALLLFNLIPGFPLDGGRVARAIAWKATGSRTRATRFAGTLGRGFAYLMIGAGVLFAVQGALVSGIWLGIIGFFLNQAARGAIAQTELTSRIEGLSVADVMDAEPVAIPAQLTADRAHDEFFLRYGWPWFPVVDSDGRLVGLVTEQSIAGLPEAVRASRTVASVMAGDSAGGDSSLRVGAEEPLEALLGREGLVRLGALMAVDGDGRLRGIVTADRVRRALRAPVTL